MSEFPAKTWVHRPDLFLVTLLWPALACKTKLTEILTEGWGSTQTADSFKLCMNCQFHSSHMPHYSSWALVIRHECKQKTNLVTTVAMIKFIREMSPSNAWQFEVKKHTEMPGSCAFPRSAALYYFTDQTHLTTCMLAPPSYRFGFVLLMVSCAPASFCKRGWVDETMRESVLGSKPSSSFPHTADLEMRAVQRHHRGFKAKSPVISLLIFETWVPSIEAIPCEGTEREVIPSLLTHCVRSLIKVLPFPCLPPLSHNFPCKTTTFQHSLGAFCACQASPQGKTGLLRTASWASICRTSKLHFTAIADYLICQSRPINFTELSRQKALTLQHHSGIKHWQTITATDINISDEHCWHLCCDCAQWKTKDLNKNEYKVKRNYFNPVHVVLWLE